MQDDLMRLDYLPNQFYNFHPGSHVGQGVEEGIRQIIEVLNIILKPEQKQLSCWRRCQEKAVKWEVVLKNCAKSLMALH